MFIKKWLGMFIFSVFQLWRHMLHFKFLIYLFYIVYFYYTLTDFENRSPLYLHIRFKRIAIKV